MNTREDLSNTTVDQVLNTQNKELIFVYNQHEYRFNLDDHGLNTESTQDEVIAAVAPVIREHSDLGIDITRGGYAVLSSDENLFLMPKPEQG